MTDFYIVGAGVVPVDRNPERIACVLCGDAGRHRRLETVIGPVCGACFEAAAPESATPKRGNGSGGGHSRQRGARWYACERAPTAL